VSNSEWFADVDPSSEHEVQGRVVVAAHFDVPKVLAGGRAWIWVYDCSVLDTLVPLGECLL
jgi:hypothetical protein